MKRKFSFLMLGAALAATGCVNLNYPLSTTYGEAQKQNVAAQVVDPTPAEGAPMMDAAMADAAVDRYHNDEVKTDDKGAQAAVVTMQMTPSGN